MGISVDLYIYNYTKLRAELVKAGADNIPLLDDILVSCGHLVGDKFFLLNNELCDDGNPYYEVSSLLDAAFPAMLKEEGVIDAFDVIVDTERDAGINYVEKEEIACRLGIALGEE